MIPTWNDFWRVVGEVASRNAGGSELDCCVFVEEVMARLYGLADGEIDRPMWRVYPLPQLSPGGTTLVPRERLFGPLVAARAFGRDRPRTVGIVASEFHTEVGQLPAALAGSGPSIWLCQRWQNLDRRTLDDTKTPVPVGPGSEVSPQVARSGLGSHGRVTGHTFFVVHLAPRTDVVVDSTQLRGRSVRSYFIAPGAAPVITPNQIVAATRLVLS